MLARISYGPVSVCLSVCPSVTSRETAERIELVFGIEAIFGLSYSVLFIRKFEYLQNNGTSVWNFVTNSGPCVCYVRSGSGMVDVVTQ